MASVRHFLHSCRCQRVEIRIFDGKMNALSLLTTSSSRKITQTVNYKKVSKNKRLPCLKCLSANFLTSLLMCWQAIRVLASALLNWQMSVCVCCLFITLISLKRYTHNVCFISTVTSTLDIWNSWRSFSWCFCVCIAPIGSSVLKLICIL